MSSKELVAIFWDYENCHPASNLSGYEVVSNIRRVAHEFGNVTLFKAYLELTTPPSSKSLSLRSELQSSGVSLTDCPHNGRKDVADKMILVDMLAYAIDNQAPTTIILITGDRDFAYAVSVLRLRRYHVVVIAPPIIHISLKSQASVLIDWSRDILGKTDGDPETPKKPPTFMNECNSEFFASRSEFDRKASVMTFSLATESSEGVEDASLPVSSSVGHEGDTLRYDPRRLVPKILLGRTSTSMANTNNKLQQSATEFPGANCSLLRMQVSGEPTAPPSVGYPSRVLGRPQAPMTLADDTPTSSEHVPRIFRQTGIMSGRTPLSRGAKLGFGMGLTSRPSLFGSLGNQATTSGDLGNKNDVCGALDGSGETSASTTKAGVLSSLSVEAQGGRSLLCTPEMESDNAQDITLSTMSPSSSFITSTTVQTCPGVIDTSHSPSFSDINYDGGEVADVVTASSLPTASETHTKCQSAPEIPSITSEMSSVIRRVQNDIDSGSVVIKEAHHPDSGLEPSPAGTSSHSIEPTTTPSSLVLTTNAACISPPETAATDVTRMVRAYSPETISGGPLPSKSVPPEFIILVKELKEQQSSGIFRALRSTVAVNLMKQDPSVYSRAGVAKFKEYVALAVGAKVVVIGGADGNAWISLPMSSKQNDTPAPRNSMPNNPNMSNVPERFKILVKQLQKLRLKGVERPLRSTVGSALLEQSQSLYQNAGFNTFKEYAAAAEKAGIVQLGGSDGQAWISLRLV